MICVLPNAAGLLFEGSPAFEIRDTRRLVSTFHALHRFLDALERNRVFDDSVIVA